MEPRQPESAVVLVVVRAGVGALGSRERCLAEMHLHGMGLGGRSSACVFALLAVVPRAMARAAAQEGSQTAMAGRGGRGLLWEATHQPGI